MDPCENRKRIRRVEIRLDYRNKLCCMKSVCLRILPYLRWLKILDFFELGRVLYTVRNIRYFRTTSDTSLNYINENSPQKIFLQKLPEELEFNDYGSGFQQIIWIMLKITHFSIISNFYNWSEWGPHELVNDGLYIGRFHLRKEIQNGIPSLITLLRGSPAPLVES
jgi:hypothetical protein